MNQNAERASLLESLVAVSGDEGLREMFAESPPDRIRMLIADIERANDDIARRGRLAAEWAAPVFEAEDDVDRDGLADGPAAEIEKASA